MPLVTVFYLKSILHGIGMVTQLSDYHCMQYLINLFVSLGLRWISHRQQMTESCYFIHSTNHSLPIGEFNPFLLEELISVTFLLVLYFFYSLIPPLLLSSVFNWFCIVLLWFLSHFLFCIFVSYFLSGYPGYSISLLNLKQSILK